MIKNEIIEVKISNKTISYYLEIYTNIKINDIIEIPTINIQNGSNVKITGVCDYCGSEKKISKKSYNSQTNYGKEKFTCSKKCSLIKSSETNLKKYGVENPFQSKEVKDKIKKTNLKKYGVENPQQSEEIKERVKITNLKKYGFEKPLMSDIIREKVRDTNNKKFGVDYPAQSSYIRHKMEISCFNKYGVFNFSKTDTFKDIISNRSFNKMLERLESHGDLIESNKGEYMIKCRICDSEFSILHTLMYNRIHNDEPICIVCNPKNQNIKENELYDFINTNYDGEIIKNCRKIISKELDIYLPELNLAFEFNGLYWHSDLYKSRNYHLNKTKECDDKGIKLVHVWEDDWVYKRDIIKSMILHKLGKSKSIWARNCEISEVTDNKLIRDFLNKNHLQGFVGSSIKIGLFYQGELVSLITFGKLRKALGHITKEGSYELLRFCNKLNFNIVGGSSRLLVYFIRKYYPKEIMSYSDNSRSNGDMYRKIGFNLESETVPNYYWVIDGIRKHRFNFRKDRLVKMGYDSSKTEIEIMNELGYYRIFDSGSKKWINRP